MNCSHRLSAVTFKLYMIFLHCRGYLCQHSWSCLWCLSFFVSYNFTATCYPYTDQGKCIFMRNKNYHLLHVVRNCVKKKIVKTCVVDGKEIFGLTASSEAQGRIVGSAETAPQKFSSTGTVCTNPTIFPWGSKVTLTHVWQLHSKNQSRSQLRLTRVTLGTLGTRFSFYPKVTPKNPFAI